MSKRISAFFLLFLALACAGADIVWPTESKAFANGEPVENFIQPTQGGAIASGLFGDVRNGGYRFHEGIDVKPVRRSKKGEALDEIYCAADGVVAMASSMPGNSLYGRYVVVVHDSLDVPVYTLYAHLGSVNAGIRAGERVRAGQTIGIMGRSSSSGLPKTQSHLHFEMGLRMSDNFQPWYDSKKFGSKNHFGNYNGMNLTGFDPLHMFETAKAGKLASFKAYIQSLPTAYVVRIYTKKTPDFVKMYPMLVDDDGQKVGWDVHFTWYGLPQKFARIKDPRGGAREGDVEVVMHNPDEMQRKCRRFVVIDSKGNVVITDDMKDHLRLIF